MKLVLYEELIKSLNLNIEFEESEDEEIYNFYEEVLNSWDIQEIKQEECSCEGEDGWNLYIVFKLTGESGVDKTRLT